MIMNKYISGTKVRSIATFLDFTGAPANTTATLKYRPGAGATQTIASGSISTSGTGIYYFDIDTTGWTGPDDLLYTCQWSGSGAVQAIGLDYFEVEPAAL